MITYPSTYPNAIESVASKKHVSAAEHCCHTVSYAEDNQQSTNNDMKNGENSDHR